MAIYEEHFLRIIEFIKLYESLINCHLVDFLTESLWENCLPEDLRLCLEEKSNNVIVDFQQFNELYASQDSKLSTFLRDINSMKLESCNDVLSWSNFLNVLNCKRTDVSKLQPEFMKVKKWYEVDLFTKTIAWINQDEPSIVIDAGAGKGYSSVHLSNNYKFPVLAIECSHVNHKGAILHRNLVNKKNKQFTALTRYAVAQIDESTDFVQMVKNYFPDLYLQKKLFMTALHACGSLTDSVIKSFLNISDIKYLCIVPCCYHLVTKSLLNVYEFSKNSRMLAQQSVDKMKQNRKPLSQSLFYRAILEVILKGLGIKNAKIGRGAPLDNFITYIKWSLKKVGATEIPSDEDLDKIYDKYKHFEWKFNVFQLLRIELAPVIEAAIILDKILFIKKSENYAKLEAIQLFNPVISSRSWAIIAKK